MKDSLVHAYNQAAWEEKNSLVLTARTCMAAIYSSVKLQHLHSLSTRKNVQTGYSKVVYVHT